MALRINTNVASMNAYNQLNQINKQLSLNQERLASGYKINKAADDAAGLVISTKFGSQIAGNKAAVKNVENGINLVQTADKSLEVVQKLLEKAKTLALSSMDGSKSDSERTANNQELTEIKASIDRIVDATKFGDKKLLDGTNATLTFQMGATAGDTYTMTLNDMNAAKIGDGTNFISAAAVDTTTTATTALATIEGAIDQVAAERGRLGGIQANTFEATKSALEIQIENLTAAKASIDETDMAAEMAE
jgi:flagellin